MKKSELQAVLGSPEPDAYMKDRLSAKLDAALPPKRGWLRRVGVAVAACVLFAAAGTALLRMAGEPGGPAALPGETVPAADAGGSKYIPVPGLHFGMSVEEAMDVLKAMETELGYYDKADARGDLLPGVTDLLNSYTTVFGEPAAVRLRFMTQTSSWGIDSLGIENGGLREVSITFAETVERDAILKPLEALFDFDMEFEDEWILLISKSKFRDLDGSALDKLRDYFSRWPFTKWDGSEEMIADHSHVIDTVLERSQGAMPQYGDGFGHRHYQHIATGVFYPDANRLELDGFMAGCLYRAGADEPEPAPESKPFGEEIPYYDGTNGHLPVLRHTLEAAPAYIQDQMKSVSAHGVYAPGADGAADDGDYDDRFEDDRYWYFRAYSDATAYASEMTEDSHIVRLYCPPPGEEGYVIVSMKAAQFSRFDVFFEDYGDSGPTYSWLREGWGTDPSSATEGSDELIPVPGLRFGMSLEDAMGVYPNLRQVPFEGGLLNEPGFPEGFPDGVSNPGPADFLLEEVKVLGETTTVRLRFVVERFSLDDGDDYIRAAGLTEVFIQFPESVDMLTVMKPLEKIYDINLGGGLESKRHFRNLDDETLETLRAYFARWPVIRVSDGYRTFFVYSEAFDNALSGERNPYWNLARGTFSPNFNTLSLNGSLAGILYQAAAEAPDEFDP
ncbi:MAG: hypothetical protein FWG72_03180 [Oscillospiraceae bacterium]|nr:hypothetical protein [Oscillospiraceae bacterium]